MISSPEIVKRVSYLPLLFLFISKTELNVFYSHMREGTNESTYNHRRFLLAKHKNPVLLFFFFFFNIETTSQEVKDQ